MTNGERIRQMNENELAYFLKSVAHDTISAMRFIRQGKFENFFTIKEWLESEADE